MNQMNREPNVDIFVIDEVGARHELSCPKGKEEKAVLDLINEGQWFLEPDDCSLFVEYAWGYVYVGEIEGWASTSVHPPPPPCEDGHDHDFQQSPEFGGLAENPGVFGHGGGVIVYEKCRRCGIVQVTDTWTQDRETGSVYESVRYEDHPDDL